MEERVQCELEKKGSTPNQQESSKGDALSHHILLHSCRSSSHVAHSRLARTKSGGGEVMEVDLDVSPAHRAPRFQGSALLEMLQDDVIVVLMGNFLSTEEVCRMAMTCRHVRQICVLSSGSVELWRKVCEKTWEGPSATLEVRDWRTFAWERRLVDARWKQKGFSESSVVVFKFEQAPVFNVHRQGDVMASAEDNCIKIWDVPRRRLEKTLPTNSTNMVGDLVPTCTPCIVYFCVFVCTPPLRTTFPRALPCSSLTLRAALIRFWGYGSILRSKSVSLERPTATSRSGTLRQAPWGVSLRGTLGQSSPSTPTVRPLVAPSPPPGTIL